MSWVSHSRNRTCAGFGGSTPTGSAITSWRLVQKRWKCIKQSLSQATMTVIQGVVRQSLDFESGEDVVSRSDMLGCCLSSFSDHLVYANIVFKFLAVACLLQVSALVEPSKAFISSTLCMAEASYQWWVVIRFVSHHNIWSDSMSSCQIMKKWSFMTSCWLPLGVHVLATAFRGGFPNKWSLDPSHFPKFANFRIWEYVECSCSLTDWRTCRCRHIGRSVRHKSQMNSWLSDPMEHRPLRTPQGNRVQVKCLLFSIFFFHGFLRLCVSITLGFQTPIQTQTKPTLIIYDNIIISNLDLIEPIKYEDW